MEVWRGLLERNEGRDRWRVVKGFGELGGVRGLREFGVEVRGCKMNG